MKKLFTLLTAICFSAVLIAQSPQRMSYQAVVRNAADELVVSTNVGMQITILQGSPAGIAVYIETHNPATNANGLVSIEIGGGTLVSGSFATIDWADGPYFLKTETDPTGGNSYSITGTSQLLSVPYALYAANSGSSTPGPQGPQGEQGPAGPQGPQGETGEGVGIPGPQGPAGPQGATGATGMAGAQGPMGMNGAQGPAGPAGPPGNNGVQGAAGPMGPQGEQGPPGAAGPQGPAGPQGGTGSTGPIGPQGEQGVPGPQGGSGIVNAAFVSAEGNNPNTLTPNTFGFVGAVATVTITAGQKIIVNTCKAMGSSLAGGANGLNIVVAYRLITDTPLSYVGSGIYSLSCAQNSRQTYTINGVTPALAAGTYYVGMAASAANPGLWNLNEFGTTTVIVTN